MGKLELTAYKSPLQRASNDVGALCTATVKKNHKQKKRRCGYIYTNIWKTQKYRKFFKNIDPLGQPIHLHTHTLLPHPPLPSHLLSFSRSFSHLYTSSSFGEWFEHSISIMGGWGYLFWKKKEPILSFPFPVRQEKCSSFRSKLFSTWMTWKSVSPQHILFPSSFYFSSCLQPICDHLPSDFTSKSHGGLSLGVFMLKRRVS